MSFEQVVTPALELASHGFPDPGHVCNRAPGQQRRQTSSSTKEDTSPVGPPAPWDIFYPGGEALGIGDLLVQADLAPHLPAHDRSRGAPQPGRVVSPAYGPLATCFYKG